MPDLPVTTMVTFLFATALLIVGERMLKTSSFHVLLIKGIGHLVTSILCPGS